MFWNVEKFGGTPERVEAVRDHIRAINPDVFCLCEIYDKAALRGLLFDEFEDYDFGVTDGAQAIELVAGWRRGMFDQGIYTQRREFKAGSNNLRPGSLLSIKRGNDFCNLLFLHTDSGTSFRDYDNRLEMYDKIWSLKGKLDEITDGGEAKLIVMGDLNTMGKERSGSYPEVTAETEIENLNDDAARVDMGLLSKSHDETLAWIPWGENDYSYSNLDHALATNGMAFVDLLGPTGSAAQTQVDGWVHLSDEQEREVFIESISDHCSITVEIDF